jgi:hypothetical protein
MPLRGTLDTMPLPDLLQWLGASRKTGTVSLSQGPTTKSLFIENGLVVGSGSNEPADFLGQLLLSLGKVTEEQLRDALAAQQGTCEVLGALMLRLGMITESDLNRALRLKTEETIYSLFSWERAEFTFDDGSPDAFPFPVALTVEDILLKGAKRFDEVNRIRELVPTDDAIPRLTAKDLPPEVRHSPNLRTIAAAIDGARSVASLALQTHTSTYLVGKFVYEGIRAGLIELVEPARPEPKVLPAGLTEAATRLFEAGDYDGVLTLLSGTDMEPGSPAHEMLERSEAMFADGALQGSLRPERIPTLLRPVTDLMSERLSPEEFFLISRIDGNWSIGSIIAVSPLREVEALRVLARLEKRGFISISDPAPAPARALAG